MAVEILSKPYRGISVKLPLTYDKTDGPYKLTKTLVENVKQNFKHMLLTNPGERIMLPNFGVGLYRFLFEPATDNVPEEIKERLLEQKNKYLPYVTINNIETKLAKNTLFLRVEYVITPLNVSDELLIDIESNLLANV